MASNPMVGITWSGDLVERSAGAGENALRYMDLLVAGGMTPVLVTPRAGKDLIARLDGLLLPGGPDIAPEHYHQAAGEHLEDVVPELDALELELFDAARSRNLPVLGICRGQQLVNVALGGTLHQHVVHPQWGDDRSAPAHQVRIVEGTCLHRALGVATADVNSGHHQAVDVVATPLTASAHSPDGCVEALEAEPLLIMAVQWHPDEMPGAPTSRRLMAWFARWMGATPA